ncbi:hypothetical protein ZTR_03099 [Talaromyces verruculosus]|nr:hypothetical protein ZTR_03099 [Talaromyces verruculosus]
MTEFDMYMTKAQRIDNSKMAHMAGDRFDGYGEDVESHEPVEYEGFSDFMPIINIRFLSARLDRPSTTYMEEEEETLHKITLTGNQTIHFQSSDRSSQLPTNEDMHIGEDLGDKFSDDIEQGQSSEYELRSSEDHHLEVDIISTNNHRNNLIFDQSLGLINNPPSVSGTRMSGSHVSKKPEFQRQGYGA